MRLKNDTEFGRLVRIRLVELGMTQTELAQILGTNKQYITAILSGQRTGEKYLDKIRDILDLDNIA